MGTGRWLLYGWASQVNLRMVQDEAPMYIRRDEHYFERHAEAPYPHPHYYKVRGMGTGRWLGGRGDAHIP